MSAPTCSKWAGSEYLPQTSSKQTSYMTLFTELMQWAVYRVSFGSNGIYVGGKDTFLSELSGNFSMTGEMAPVSVTGAPGPVARITVQLGSAASTVAPAIAK